MKNNSVKAAFTRSEFLEVITGHCLIVLSGVFYSAAWILNAGTTNGIGNGLTGALFIGAILSGLIGLTIIAIVCLSAVMRGLFPFWKLASIWAADFLLFLLSAYGAGSLFQRQFTSELLFLFFWAGVEAGIMSLLLDLKELKGIKGFITPALLAMSLLVGLYCYIIHYQLSGFNQFINGLIPYGVSCLSVGALVLFLLPGLKKRE